ncbi:hypothetical protein AMYX_07860 [Anaeromyxobacter diazotrophicus]|uniref:Uncharacterized protein n=1 Tax=Anaeromyxobacter diazotrophicus TaxID=2590199 RepID=A0A7I9VI63_9BACT|nr:hypothetical protein AMYX_07860 [Anaeromyxobacter diazotrophicus]
MKVLQPALDVERPHACHLFPGGRICLGAEQSGGAPTLESAYARSVVWANGYSVYQREGAFPF